MIAMATSDSAGWLPPVLTAVASTGTGVDEVVGAIVDHRSWAIEHGELQRRRTARAREEVVATVVGMLRARLDDDQVSPDVESAAAQVASGEVDVHSAAERVWGIVSR
jgi:LAO/AO transport system kinase